MPTRTVGSTGANAMRHAPRSRNDRNGNAVAREDDEDGAGREVAPAWRVRARMNHPMP